MRPPRDAADVLAAQLGVTRAHALDYIRRYKLTHDATGAVELDALLGAEAALADLEAARQVDDIDIADAADEADPAASLAAMTRESADRILQARLAAYSMWAKCDDRAERTRRAREAFDRRFERQVDPDGRLDPVERHRRVEYARKAYFLRLAIASAKARRKRRKE